MMNKKMMLVLAGVSLLFALSAQATPIVSDDFNDGVTGSQWTNTGMTESGGTVNASLATNTTAYYASTTGYTLSGDFDVQIDLTVNSVSGTSTTTWSSVNYLYLYNDTNNRVSLQYRLEGSTWKAWSSITTSAGCDVVNVAYPLDNLNPQLRQVRTGTTMAVYIRSQAGGAWTLVDQQTGISTGDMTVQFGSVTAPGISGSVSYDNFVVPEPATMTLLGLGGVAALIRRRR